MIEPKTQAVTWRGEASGSCVILDQTRLPSMETYDDFQDYRGVVKAIQTLAVRGAPAIGVAGAYAVVLAYQETLTKKDPVEAKSFLENALNEIASARPTAVNLGWAVNKMRGYLQAEKEISAQALTRLHTEAAKIHREDIQSNQRMAQFGMELLPKAKAVMTYCNTGDLATGGVGTAFGVLHAGFRAGKVTHVFACETRPVMQGLRLTAWELAKNEIPFTVICDNMAALTLRAGTVGAIIVGADRIAANGDAANKVGTYGLAVLAKHHGIPFYIAAPTSTFDLSIASGDEIPIEERAGTEILGVLHQNQHPYSVTVNNPSFDVTPRELITAIICEKGVIRQPSVERVQRVIGKNDV